MNERYTRLFLLPGISYAEGAPVIIKAGALLKDSETDGVLAQLKFQSISDKKIKYLKVALVARDPMDRTLGNEIIKEYLDLNVSRNTEFGSKIPIVINYKSARSFSACVTEVGFEDNSCWFGNTGEWLQLQKQQTLSENFDDDYQIEEYARRFGCESKYMPLIYKDIWVCTCGKINKKSKNICNHCRADIREMIDIDKTTLHNDGAYNKAAELIKTNEIRNVQAAQEILSKISDWKDADELLITCKQKIEELNAQAAAECLKKEKRVKRIKSIATVTMSIVCVATIFVVLLYTVIIPSSKYNKATELMEAEKYDEARLIFEELNEYKDSLEKIEECNAFLDQLADFEYEWTESGYSIIGVKNKDKAYYVIPNCVTSIGDHAFYYCTSLTSITIPDSVTSIGDHAFFSCMNLRSVTFENKSGWKCGTEDFSISELDDASKAASYLRFKYCKYTWTRS